MHLLTNTAIESDIHAFFILVIDEGGFEIKKATQLSVGFSATRLSFSRSLALRVFFCFKEN